MILDVLYDLFHQFLILLILIHFIFFLPSNLFHHIEHPESLKRVDSQQNRENGDLVDTDIELDTNTVVEDTTEITESQLNDEGL